MKKVMPKRIAPQTRTPKSCLPFCQNMSKFAKPVKSEKGERNSGARSNSAAEGDSFDSDLGAWQNQPNPNDQDYSRRMRESIESGNGPLKDERGMPRQ